MANRALDNKCPACGAPILYKPNLKKWKCDYCKSEFTLEEMKKYNNASSEKNNKKEEKSDVKDTTKNTSKDTIKKEKDNTAYVEYNCKDCGAKIIADEQTTATFCIYCGNTAILKEKLSGKFAPDLIIPFKNEKEKAIESFKSLNKGRPLMPDFFNDEKNIEKIRGVYIPFWLFDVKVSGELDATSTTSTSWTVGNTVYTKTDTYRLEREGEMEFNKIPVDGSTRFDDDIMNTIEPFNYEDLEEYNHAYLSGFLAEKYDIEEEKSFNDATLRSLNSTRDEMKRDMGMGIKSIINDTLKAEKLLTKYALLPVWMINVKYKDKFYTFAMNGQTGEFVGNIPVDKKKALKYGILTFAITFALVLLISYLFYIGGHKWKE